MTFSHYSVLQRETIEALRIRPDGIYVDGTLGGGGRADSYQKTGIFMVSTKTERQWKRRVRDFRNLEKK